MLIVRATSGAISRAGVRRAAVRAALGAAVAAPLALAGTQAGLAGTPSAGTGWVMLPAPPLPAGDTAGSWGPVSCTAPGACMAVGSASNTTSQQALTEAWNGTSWTLENIPNAAQSELFSVSCPAAADCVAVGRTSAEAPLAEFWNGTSWSAQNLPLPSGLLDTTLFDVSCTTPSRCVAVGTGGSPIPVSESWNGTTWTPHTVTLPGNATGEFLGVSCRSYRSCVAVGEIRNSTGFGPMAALWNGRSWTVENVPSPSGPSTDTTLQAVSCYASTDCIAVGGAGGPGAFQTLAEHWNGTAWTIMPMPRLGGAKAASVLASVSCPRATRCTAAGHATIKTKTRLLAEHWNGTHWTVQTSVEPPNVQYSDFSGVSCLAKQGCIAFGGYSTRSGKTSLLAEQHS